MHVEAEINIARPRAQVFEFLARSEHLPDYATDFVWVKAPTSSSSWHQSPTGCSGSSHR
jgi:hypothetical protein